MKKALLVFAALVPFLLSSKVAFAEDPAPLTVISYNIRMGSGKDGTNSWEYRYPASAMMIMDQKPDIFGLQEAFDYQQKYLKEYCPGYKCIGVGRENGKHRGEHMSIFYNKKRIKLIDWGTFWLSETPSKPSMGWDAACHRTATWVLMKDKTTGKKFFYVNTHLDHRSAPAQKNGLALIVNRIGQMNPDHLPMILTGDFNIRPDSENLVELDKMMHSARIFAESTTTDGSFNGWGEFGASSGAPAWHGDVPVKEAPIIDYIYYSGFSNCLTFKVLNHPYVGVPYISDHYPIAATLKF